MNLAHLARILLALIALLLLVELGAMLLPSTAEAAHTYRAVSKLNFSTDSSGYPPDSVWIDVWDGSNADTAVHYDHTDAQVIWPAPYKPNGGATAQDDSGMVLVKLASGDLTEGHLPAVLMSWRDGIGYITSEWVPLRMQPEDTAGVNVAQISADRVAADNFETMLDGDGGNTLSLGRLVVSTNGADPAVEITQSGTDDAVQITSTNSLTDGIYITGGNDAVSLVGSAGDGLDIVGFGAGGYGIRVVGNGDTAMWGETIYNEVRNANVGSVSDNAIELSDFNGPTAWWNEGKAGYSADVSSISLDTAAADNFETMLDGNGGNTLSLGRLVVDHNGSTPAVSVLQQGSGEGLLVSNVSSGDAVAFRSTSGGDAFEVHSQGAGNAMWVHNTSSGIAGNFEASADWGLKIQTGSTASDTAALAVISNGGDPVNLSGGAGAGIVGGLDTLYKGVSATANFDSADASFIADTVDARLTAAHGSGAWTSGGAGSGSSICSLFVKDSLGDALIADAEVTVFAVDTATLASGTGPQTTGAGGFVVFSLDDATYPVDVGITGYLMESAYQSVTVSGTTKDTIWLYTYTPSIVAGADSCVLVIHTDHPYAKAEFSMDEPRGKPVRSSGGTYLNPNMVKADADSNGTIQQALAVSTSTTPRCTYHILVKSTKGDEVIAEWNRYAVPDSASATLLATED